MTPEILNQYYDRIYGYAHRHTFNEEEAADLTQDILYTVLTQLPTLKNEAGQTIYYTNDGMFVGSPGSN